ncbi:MAG: photosystem I protein PsaX [Microcoleaceae cyanobacterium]
MNNKSGVSAYPFRTFWAILLLVVNFYVAYLYYKGIS